MNGPQRRGGEFRLKRRGRRFACVRRRGHNGADARTDDAGLHDEVVGASDHDEVLHIVPAQEKQLPLAVQFENIDDAEPGLASADPLSRQLQATAGDAPQKQAGDDDKDKDQSERYDRLDRRGQLIEAQHDVVVLGRLIRFQRLAATNK